MQTTSEHSSQTDEQLVALAVAGDQAAFAAFFERHFAAIYDFAVRMAERPGSRRRATQGTFVTPGTNVTGTGRAIA